ncbi:MAG: hypothetical protein A2Z18_02935 [Armatimonadetes bacterium RBG_16_58_9]|nr:MAG: hypothetical protein A2Z18_02935 [Armatimonadetes bacterium RBG_16_58_9]
MGGISSERDISLVTGKQILDALDRDKYEPFGVDAALMLGSGRTRQKSAGTEIEAVSQTREALLGSDKLASVARIAIPDTNMRTDVAVIALHGKYGEDGTIQGMLELLGIPYTGSGVLASALAMDKSMAKRVLAGEGIPVPPSVDFTCGNGTWNMDSVARAVAEMGYPVVVKPSRQGSTIGMTKVNAPDELNNAIKEAVGYDTRILVESFIKGTELTVGVLGSDEPFALPVIEIVPKKGFYDYEAKYTPGATDKILPARISEQDASLAREISLSAHRALDCRGMSRVDLISGSAGMYVLEVNTIPGLTPTSLLPRAAEAAGISFGRLLDMLIEYALEDRTLGV